MARKEHPIPPGFIWDFQSMRYKHPDGRTWDDETNRFFDQEGNLEPTIPGVIGTDGAATTETVEQQVKRLGATAPRVTPEMVQAAIRSVYFFTALNGVNGNGGTVPLGSDVEPLSLTTFCALVLHNGYTVYGKSACASPANYREEIGRRVAREDAESQVWPLLGYSLRNNLHHMEQGG